jgi:hypothetical protein
VLRSGRGDAYGRMRGVEGGGEDACCALDVCCALRSMHLSSAACPREQHSSLHVMPVEPSRSAPDRRGSRPAAAPSLLPSLIRRTHLPTLSADGWHCLSLLRCLTGRTLCGATALSKASVAVGDRRAPYHTIPCSTIQYRTGRAWRGDGWRLSDGHTDRPIHTRTALPCSVRTRTALLRASQARLSPATTRRPQATGSEAARPAPMESEAARPHPTCPEAARLGATPTEERGAAAARPPQACGC